MWGGGQTLYKLVPLNSKLHTPVKGMNDSMDQLNPSIPIVEVKGKTEKLTAEKTQISCTCHTFRLNLLPRIPFRSS